MNLQDIYCSYNKSDFLHDKDILGIISSDFTIENVLYTCTLAPQREHLPVVRLNADIFFRGLGQKTEIPDIEAAVQYICGRDNFLLIECIKKLSDLPVVIEISGGFSSLLATTGSEYIIRQIRKQKDAVLSAIYRINLYTVELVKSATAYGVKLISFADPSALVSVMGEERLAALSAQPSLELIRGISVIKNVLMHICPRTSFALEKYCGCIFTPYSCKKNTILEELVNIDTRDSIVLTGHVCISADIGNNNLCIMTHPF